MEKDKQNPAEQGNTTDPQEREKDGNIFGKLSDALHGDSKGDNSVSEDESHDPENQQSIKE